MPGRNGLAEIDSEADRDKEYREEQILDRRDIREDAVLVDALAHSESRDKGSENETQIHQRSEECHANAESCHGEGEKLSTARICHGAEQPGNDIARKDDSQCNKCGALAKCQCQHRPHGFSLASGHEKGGHEHKKKDDKNVLKNCHAEGEAGTGAR